MKLCLQLTDLCIDGCFVVLVARPEQLSATFPLRFALGLLRGRDLGMRDTAHRSAEDAAGRGLRNGGMSNVPTNQSAQPARSERLDRPKQTTASDARPPWRVEGARGPQETTRWRPPPKRPGLWVLLCLLLALDWFVVLAFQPSVPARVTVPYSSFVSQTHQSNVALATRQG